MTSEYSILEKSAQKEREQRSWMILFFVEIYFLIIQLETSMNSRSLEIFFTLCFCHANIARNAFRHVRLVRPSKLIRAMGRFSDVWYATI